jgi:hypothetical protein
MLVLERRRFAVARRPRATDLYDPTTLGRSLGRGSTTFSGFPSKQLGGVGPEHACLFYDPRELQRSSTPRLKGIPGIEPGLDKTERVCNVRHVRRRDHRLHTPLSAVR